MTRSLAYTWLLLIVWSLLPSEARADYIIYLNFSGFSLQEYEDAGAPCTNTAANRAFVRDYLRDRVAEAYSDFEVQVTDIEPTSGWYLEVPVGGLDPTGGGFWGLAPVGDWLAANKPMDPSRHGAFTDAGVGSPGLNGADGTCTRIANAFANVAAHESGHVIGLGHNMAYNDCPSAMPGTDTMVNFHIMSTGEAGGPGLTSVDMAERHLVFSPECSRWVLQEELKPSRYYQKAPDSMGSNGADIVVGGWDYTATLGAPYFVFESVGTSMNPLIGSAFVGPSPDLGVDVVLSGDVDSDGRDDLVWGRPKTISTAPYRVMEWQVGLADGTGGYRSLIYTPTVYGEVGDVFRLGDVTGDGRADLVRGHNVHTAQSEDLLDFYVMSSGGTYWTSPGLWATSTSNRRNLHFLVDIGDDSRLDLVYAEYEGTTSDRVRRCHPGSSLCGPPTTTKWWVQRSTGTYFASQLQLTTTTASDLVRTSLFFFADLNSDGSEDLVRARLASATSGPGTYIWGTYSMNAATNTLSSSMTSLSSLDGRVVGGNMLRIGDYDNSLKPDIWFSDRSLTDASALPWYGVRSTTGSLPNFLSTTDTLVLSSGPAMHHKIE